MNFIEHISRWIAENQDALDRAGTLSVSDSTGTHPKQAVHVALQREDRFAEVIVWDTGEAEFGLGSTNGPQSDEHYDLVDTFELDQLLDRFFSRIADWPL